MATTALQILNSSSTIVSSAILEQETLTTEEGPNYGPDKYYDTRVRRVKVSNYGSSPQFTFADGAELTSGSKKGTYVSFEVVGSAPEVTYIFFYYKKVLGSYTAPFTSSDAFSGVSADSGSMLSSVPLDEDPTEIKDTMYVPYTTGTSGITSWVSPPNIWSDVLTIGPLQPLQFFDDIADEWVETKDTIGGVSSTQDNFLIHDYVANDKIVFNPLFIFDRINSVHPITPQTRKPYQEPITSKDVIRNVASYPVVGTSDKTVPWFYVKLAFTDINTTIYATYGKDSLITRASGFTRLYRGIIQNGVTIKRDSGDAIYGSLIFPTVGLTFDNTEGDFDFLKDNPEVAYSGVCHITRWDVISNSLKHEYSGVVTSYSRESNTVSLDFAIIGSHTLDKTIPIDTSEVINQKLLIDSGTILGRFFGRCNSVRCVNIQKTDIGEYPIDYRYHAGWGRNLITKVFRDSLQIPKISENSFGYILTYDALTNQTLVSFTGAEQLDSNITAHIEGLRTPEHNLLKATQEFEGTDSTGTPYWTINSSYSATLKDNVFFDLDGRKTSSYVSIGEFPAAGQISSTFISQSVTLSDAAPNGLLAYAIIRDVTDDERKHAKNVGISNPVTNDVSISNSTSLLTCVDLKIDGTEYSPHDNTNNTYSGLISLGNKWYIRWIKVNVAAAVGNVVDFRLRQPLHAFSQWVAGTFLMIDTKSVTSNADIDHAPYEQVFGYRSDQDIEGYASSRNFAYNIKDILISNHFGLGDLLVDQTSFDKAAYYSWSKFYYCDGPLDEKRQATQVLNDMLMAGNMRLERFGVFREWKIFTDQVRPDSTINKIGRGDSYNINNIVSIRDIQSNSIDDYPKELKFPCVPVRDGSGSLNDYKRIRERKDLVGKYGKTITLTNEFVRYEITADVILENVKNKLLNSFQTFDITLKEDFAWNLEIDEVVAFYDPILGLDDTVVNGDTVQPLFEITRISKSEEYVKITIRNFNNTTYDYTGTYPVDRDGDNLFITRQTPLAGNPSAPPVSIPISGGTGTKIPGPDSSSAHLFVRTTGQLNGHELVVSFYDGTEVILAKSSTGSLPADKNIIKRLETRKFNDPTQSTVTRINAPESEVTTFINGAAMINEIRVPKIEILGVDMNIRIMKDSDVFESLSRFDSPDTVLLYAYDQKLLTHPDLSNNDVKITYDMDATPSSYIYSGVVYDDSVSGASTGVNVTAETIPAIADGPPHNYIYRNKLISGSGDFIRGIKYITTHDTPSKDHNNYWSVCRRFREDLSTKVYKFMIFNPLSLRTSSVGSQELMLTARQFSPQGCPEKDFVFGHMEFVINPIPITLSTSTTSRQAFDISSDGTPYAIISDATAGSWLCRLIEIGDLEGSYKSKENGVQQSSHSLAMRSSPISGLVADLEVVACAWDINADELHVCVKHSEDTSDPAVRTQEQKVYVLKLDDNSVEPSGPNYLGVSYVREYHVGYEIYTYTFDEYNNVFYATVDTSKSSSAPSLGGILVIDTSGNILTTAGQPVSKTVTSGLATLEGTWSITDVTCGLDGFVYFTYIYQDENSVKRIKLAKISYANLLTAKLDSAVTCHTRDETSNSITLSTSTGPYPTPSARAFINVIPIGAKFDTTQIQ